MIRDKGNGSADLFPRLSFLLGLQFSRLVPSSPVVSFASNVPIPANILLSAPRSRTSFSLLLGSATTVDFLVEVDPIPLSTPFVLCFVSFTFYSCKSMLLLSISLLPCLQQAIRKSKGKEDSLQGVGNCLQRLNERRRVSFSFFFVPPPTSLRIHPTVLCCLSSSRIQPSALQ